MNFVAFRLNIKLTVSYGKSALWKISVTKITIKLSLPGENNDGAVHVNSLFHPIQCVGNHTHITKKKSNICDEFHLE